MEVVFCVTFRCFVHEAKFHDVESFIHGLILVLTVCQVWVLGLAASSLHRLVSGSTSKHKSSRSPSGRLLRTAHRVSTGSSSLGQRLHFLQVQFVLSVQRPLLVPLLLGLSSWLEHECTVYCSLVECCSFTAECLLLKAFLYPAGGSTSPGGLASIQLLTRVFSAGALVAFPLLEECSWCSKASAALSCQLIASLEFSSCQRMSLRDSLSFYFCAPTNLTIHLTYGTAL